MTAILEGLGTLTETTKLVLLGGGLMIIGFVVRRLAALVPAQRPDEAGNTL